jgi:LIVCS family branched-chain amino acid:cation transporter
MTSVKQTFIYGFAIFSMFFGSGNLVFPLQIGQTSNTYWLSGFLGLFLTGILLPFLGLFVIKLHKGSYEAFFGEAGYLAKLTLPLFTLSLLGSFGVVPRCITVAHGGIEYIYPEISLGLFSLIFSILCFITCIRDHFMITVLGKWMTPLLLACLLILISLGVYQAESLPNTAITRTSAFKNGFLIGYLPMDLFAAFFFSALIFNQIHAKLKTENHAQVLKAALKPSIIGSVLLTLVYLGFVYLGAHYTNVTLGVAPELILPTIAQHLLGTHAMYLIGIIVLFSCLTTAVALNNIYAHYLCTLLNLKKDKFLYVLMGTTALSFIVSLLDFQGIAKVLAPLLEVSYPSIIALTIMSIFIKDRLNLKIGVFYAILTTSLLWRFLS